MANLNAVIRTAKNEVGYLEKKSNSQLDHFTANAGKNNYTKYNRDYMAWDREKLIDIPDGSINMQWCAAFVSWCFVMAYGQKAAAALIKIRLFVAYGELCAVGNGFTQIH